MLTVADCSHIDYLLSCRFNFKNCKLVDIDNYMEGNRPFISRFQDEASRRETAQRMDTWRDVMDEKSQMSVEEAADLREQIRTMEV